MAKKSFIDKGNPAMQFISGAGEESRAKTAKAEEKKTPVEEKKKTSERAENSREIPAKPDSPKHPVAPRRQGESKSKRVQLLVPPSLYMRASRKAAEMEISFNEYVNRLLEKRGELWEKIEKCVYTHICF